MCQFIESIKLLDGEFFRLEYHQTRVNETFKFHFTTKKIHNLKSILSQQSIPESGLFKCRIRYDADIICIEFMSYSIRNIKSLKLMHTDIEPTVFKSAHREAYDHAFAQRGDCDDVLLIYNGLITDTYYCNVAFYDGRQWFTPQVPLLKGTNLSQLIDQGLVKQTDIRFDEISQFSKIRLFNAMIEFGELEFDVNRLTIS